MFQEKNIRGYTFYILEDGATPDDLIRDIIEKKGTYWTEGPVYVNHLDDICQKHELWKRFLPGIQPHYAVKCERHPVILQLLSHLGVDFDCAGKEEINKILGMGVHRDRIIQTSTHNTPASVKMMAQKHIDLTVVDTIEEMIKMVKIHPKARILLRLHFFSVGGKGSSFGIKYGCHVDDIPNFLTKAKRLGANIVGVCFMKGYNSEDPKVLSQAIRMCRTAFDLAASYGFDFNVLDIGGNYPANQDGLFGEMCDTMMETLAECFPPGVRIIAEPGRYYVATCGTVYACVIGKRNRKSLANMHAGIAEGFKQIGMRGDGGWLVELQDNLPSFNYVINDSMFHHFMFESLIDKGLPIYVEPLFQPRSANKRLHTSTIYGFSPAGGDIIKQGVELPEMEIGDWLVFRNKGHYTRSMSTKFCDPPETKEFFTVTRKCWDKIVKDALAGMECEDDRESATNHIGE